MAYARRGIFITTSNFSADARAYVDRIDKRIILIGGEELASLEQHPVRWTAFVSVSCCHLALG